MQQVQVCLYLERNDPYGMVAFLTTYGFYTTHMSTYDQTIVVYYAVDVPRLHRLTEIVLPAFMRGEIVRFEFERNVTYA
jgi:hypothetical protein